MLEESAAIEGWGVPGMSEFFSDRAALKAYLLEAASAGHETFRREGGLRLNYKQLAIQVGVTGYVLWRDRILLLERSDRVKFPGKWSTVSGYIDNLAWIQQPHHDFCQIHLVQEFHEEIGWQIPEDLALQYHGVYCLQEPEYKLHLEVFSLELPPAEPPEQRLPIVLNPEHTAYRWVPLQELRQMESRLIPGFIETIKTCGIVPLE